MRSANTPVSLILIIVCDNDPGLFQTDFSLLAHSQQRTFHTSANVAKIGMPLQAE
jgi:hypothetical protein